MTIPTEHLLNIPGIGVLSVKYDEHKIEYQIESTQGYSMCHKCGQKATEFHEHEKELELRHLPLSHQRRAFSRPGGPPRLVQHYRADV